MHVLKPDSHKKKLHTSSKDEKVSHYFPVPRDINTFSKLEM